MAGGGGGGGGGGSGRDGGGAPRLDRRGASGPRLSASRSGHRPALLALLALAVMAAALVGCGQEGCGGGGDGAAGQGTGSSPVRMIRGLVRLAESEPLPVESGEVMPCSQHADRPRQDLQVYARTRGISDVIVWLTGLPAGAAGAPAQRPAHLNQQGCEFEPRAQVVAAGSALVVANADPELHNIRARLPDERTVFNLGMAPGNPPLTVLLQRPGMMRVGCDVHPWMHAAILVVGHRFASATRRRGAFAMPAPPPGTYRLHMWHERYGEVERDLDVPSGTGDFELSLQLPASPG